MMAISSSTLEKLNLGKILSSKIDGYTEVTPWLEKSPYDVRILEPRMGRVDGYFQMRIYLDLYILYKHITCIKISNSAVF